MDYEFGFDIEVIAGVPVDDPYAYGETPADADLDWSTPTLVATYENRPVALESAIEMGTVAAPLAASLILTVYLPYGALVQRRHRVKIVDGPYAGTYEVDGDIAHWLNPYTGETPGSVVRLGKKTGG